MLYEASVVYTFIHSDLLPSQKGKCPEALQTLLDLVLRRDAVHILLGRVPKKYAESVDLSRLVVKMYSEPPSSKVLDVTSHKLHSEYESESSCVVEVIGDNTTGTTPADRGSTTRAPLNFSMVRAENEGHPRSPLYSSSFARMLWALHFILS